MKKKLLVGILVLTMLVACLAVTASAAVSVSPQNVTEVKINGTKFELTKEEKEEIKPGDGGAYYYMYGKGPQVPSYESTKVEVTAAGATLSYAAGGTSLPKAFVTNVSDALEELAGFNTYLWIKAVKGDRTEYIYINLTQTATTAQELATAFGGTVVDGKVTLAKNVTLTACLTIDTSETITLDLKGYSITGNFSGELLKVTDSAATTGKLVITDSAATKGSVSNSFVIANTFSDRSTAVNVMNAKLEVQEGVTISGGKDVISATGTNSNPSEITINGAIVKATDATKNALKGNQYVKLTISNEKTEITGAFPGGWAEESKVSAGYFTSFNPLGVNGAKSILDEGKGLVPSDKPAFTYKVGTALTESTAEGYVLINEKTADQENNRIYGNMDMLFKFYGKNNKTFHVLKDVTLTIDGYGNNNSGVFDESNTLKFVVPAGKTLTLTSTNTKVAKFEFGSTGTVTATVKPAAGYKYDATAKTCDIDPIGDKVIAVVNFKEGETPATKYLTADNIALFLKSGITDKVTSITFMSDYDLENTSINIPKAEILLDLGGHTLTYSGPLAAIVSADEGTVTVKNGTVEALIVENEDLGEYGSGIAISAGLTERTKVDGVGKPTTEKITDSHGNVIVGEDAVIKGTIAVFNKSSLTMEAGSAVEAEGFAITGNGNHDGTTITIKNGASVKSTGTAAIYHPQDGELIIGEEDSTEDAPYIEGLAGVVVRDGEVTVNNAEIVAKGTKALQVGSAKTTVPAGGIVVDSVDGYGTADTIEVVIEDASVKADASQPAVSYTEDGVSENVEIPEDMITVSGGSYSNALEEEFLSSSLKASVKESNGTVSYFETQSAAKKFAEEKGVTVTVFEGSEDLADIVDYGFIPTGTSTADANAEINKLLKANGLTEITDAGEEFFYVIFKAASTDATAATSYTVEVKSPSGKVYAKTISNVTKGGILYFTPDETNSGAITELEVGEYKFSLKNAAGTAAAKGATVIVYGVNYVGTTGVTQSKDYFVYTNKAGLDAALKAVPSVFTLDSGVNKWTFGYQDNGTYNYTVRVGGEYSAPIDPEHKCPTKGFKDMELLDTTKLWYHEAMDYMVLNGYIKGFDGVNGVKNLQPNGIATRAQMLVIMAQIKGTMIEGEDPWYDPAIAWAKKYNYSDGLRPDDPIQREEIVTILWRMAGEPKADAEAIEDYPDVASVNSWAKTAMAWAVEKGIMGGRVDEKGKDVLVPQGIGNRAELAMLIYNYVTLMK